MLPGYVVGDLMAYYQTSLYSVQLNLDNISDRHYYVTSSGDDQTMPGEPRSVMLSIDVNLQAWRAAHTLPLAVLVQGS